MIRMIYIFDARVIYFSMLFSLQMSASGLVTCITSLMDDIIHALLMYRAREERKVFGVSLFFLTTILDPSYELGYKVQQGEI